VLPTTQQQKRTCYIEDMACL